MGEFPGNSRWKCGIFWWFMGDLWGIYWDINWDLRSQTSDFFELGLSWFSARNSLVFSQAEDTRDLTLQRMTHRGKFEKVRTMGSPSVDGFWLRALCGKLEQRIASQFKVVGNCNVSISCWNHYSGRWNVSPLKKKVEQSPLDSMKDESIHHPGTHPLHDHLMKCYAATWCRSSTKQGFPPKNRLGINTSK